jgi:hypothetical protein
MSVVISWQYEIRVMYMYDTCNAYIVLISQSLGMKIRQLRDPHQLPSMRLVWTTYTLNCAFDLKLHLYDYSTIINTVYTKREAKQLELYTVH